ncbi:type II secretion system protein GspG [Chitinimonas arctica]|uniref:Type II secretion system core protein G n=1 Tax=Chitinimonas arctica TaxID=2594795 RepID=A0A516SB87_9NEIS|nr:type II secretion system major pseudopilin GspG [Chitinimonas arctica]QDQ25411.1 type II secretion system protein GspG [Chitinimonas arctica]
MPLLRRRQIGFTLLELLIALVIIGLLVGVVGPNLFKNLGKSEVTTAQQQIDALSKALEQYRLDTGHFPRTEQGLASLMAQPSDEPRWRGPYLKKAVPPDPWGQPYQYRSPGSNSRDFDLLSNGPSGRPGGTGDNAPITN